MNTLKIMILGLALPVVTGAAHAQVTVKHIQTERSPIATGV